MLKTSKKCFSLVEILVVISVLFLLISLLQPSLKKMIKSAEVVTCQNNMRQLGMAFGGYIQDFTYYPPSRKYGTKTQVQGMLVVWNDLLGYGGYDGRQLTWEEVNNRHVLSAGTIYECPTQKDYYGEGFTSLNSYSYNVNQDAANMGGFAPNNEEKSTIQVSGSDVPNPSEVILAGERTNKLGNGVGVKLGCDMKGMFRQEESLSLFPGAYHDYSFNYTFADGSVRLMLPVETYNPNVKQNIQGKYWTRDPND